MTKLTPHRGCPYVSCLLWSWTYYSRLGDEGESEPCPLTTWHALGVPGLTRCRVIPAKAPGGCDRFPLEGGCSHQPPRPLSRFPRPRSQHGTEADGLGLFREAHQAKHNPPLMDLLDDFLNGMLLFLGLGADERTLSFKCSI